MLGAARSAGLLYRVRRCLGPALLTLRAARSCMSGSKPRPSMHSTGDFQTAFNQTRLANYNRTATGVKAEARLGGIKAQGFAAEIASRFRRQEIQGQGNLRPL